MRIIRTFSLLFLALLLAGCKAQLYTGLNEKEGNDMLALLLSSGISATKELNKDQQITLFVPQDDVAKSVQLLRSNGYPKDNFSSVGDIFPKEGLISSPTEERARYTYSMSQELSATLSMIDGVLTARVHVVLPQDNNGILERVFPSSAAVFIKYSPDLVLTGFIPKVKTLVSNSIEGLSLDKITVTLFPATPVLAGIDLGPQQAQNLDNFLSIQVSPETKGRLVVLIAGVVLLLLLALIAVGVLSWIIVRKRKNETQTLRVDAEENDIAA